MCFVKEVDLLLMCIIAFTKHGYFKEHKSLLKSNVFAANRLPVGNDGAHTLLDFFVVAFYFEGMSI
jgi:hypothetical protein